VFLVVSVALHAGVFALFQQHDPPPLASVGVQSISVEIVLGTDRAAGVAKVPVQAESTVNAAAAEGEGSELVKPETARAEIKPADAVQEAEPVKTPAPLRPETAPPTPSQRNVETAVSAKPSEIAPAQPKVAELTPPTERRPVREQQPQTEAKPTATEAAKPDAPQTAQTAQAVKPEMPQAPTAAPVLTTTGPAAESIAQPDNPVAEAPPVVAAQPQAVVEMPRPRPQPPRAAEQPPQVRATEQPRRPRATVRKHRNDRGQDARTRESVSSSSAVAASGLGRGRSDAVSNYRGLIAAQLRRNMHYPPDAKRAGQEGRAVVRFTVDAGGRVSRVALVRGTGIPSLDREAEAMVHRSSPFPPPPTQQQMLFNVPVNFDIR
jgi:protein TonB